MNGGYIKNNESPENGLIGKYVDGTFTRNSGVICCNVLANKK